MSTITFGRAPNIEAAVTSAPKRRGFWSRLYFRLIAARERAALEELRRHSLRLPVELEQAGWKINERSEDSLPFVN